MSSDEDSIPEHFRRSKRISEHQPNIQIHQSLDDPFFDEDSEQIDQYSRRISKGEESNRSSGEGESEEGEARDELADLSSDEENKDEEDKSDGQSNSDSISDQSARRHNVRIDDIHLEMVRSNRNDRKRNTEEDDLKEIHNFFSNQWRGLSTDIREENDDNQVENSVWTVGINGVPYKQFDMDQKYFDWLTYENILNDSEDPNKNSQFSLRGKIFIRWNFDNLEANNFREMEFPKEALAITTRVLPRYINQLESLDANMKAVSVKFIADAGQEHKEFEFQISVYNTPKDLEEK